MHTTDSRVPVVRGFMTKGMSKGMTWGKSFWQKLVAFATHQSSSFTYLNVTQFLGALNDNLYKLLIGYFIIQLEGVENSARVLALAGAAFVVPFLLFSSPSGMLADRLSKRTVIVAVKILEFVIMAAGVFAFFFESALGSYFILFLMATQSAIFGPSKYGIIPEIVSSDRISHANGLLSSCSFLAIIIGTFLASFLTQMTNRNFVLCAFACTFFAFIGILTSFGIEYTQPAGSKRRWNPWFLWEVYETLKVASENRSLLTAIFASSYFLFVAAFFQLALIPYAMQMLYLSDVEGGYLFLLTALGIGIGSVTAAKVSGSVVELGLVPFGALGIVIGSFLMDLWGGHLGLVLPLIFSLGFFGGLYVLPLDTYIQVSSPPAWRGQLVATSNFFGFLGVLAASGFLYLVNDTLQLKADKGFSLLALITIPVYLLFGYQFFDYFTRFVGMIFSRLRFKPVYIGRENIPDSPVVYVCSHTAWNDTLLLLGGQRQRMRFFIGHEQEHKRWLKWLYRLMRIVWMPSIEPWENNPTCLEWMTDTLRKGMSVCIFVEHTDIESEIRQLQQTFNSWGTEFPYPILPVEIVKGEKAVKKGFFSRWSHVFRCPAVVSFGPAV